MKIPLKGNMSFDTLKLCRPSDGTHG